MRAAGDGHNAGLEGEADLDRYGRLRGVLLLLMVLAGRRGGAQDLEPRAYSASPVGANFVGLGYAHSGGGVVFDASLPIRDVDASVNALSVAYSRTFGLLGRTASASLAVPYAWGAVEGEVAEELSRVTRSGLADPKLRLAVNLVGGPARKPAEFAAQPRRTSLGASLVVTAPLGQYDPAKLINLGANRWAFKPELGLSHPVGPVWLEAAAGLWLLTANGDFFGGSRREQAPIGAFQAHVSYTFRPRLWLAVDATYYTGGRTTLDGIPKPDSQSNSRVGATLALPFGKHHSFKLAWASGFTTRLGSDFETVSVAWQYLWLN